MTKNRIEGSFVAMITPMNTNGSVDFEGFKTLLMKHKDKLAKSLVEGIMSYGLGRNIEFSDQDEIDKLTQQLIEDQYRAKSLIHNLVQSPAFQTK